MKLWSITTTVRNPERIRSFLQVFKELEGQQWDDYTQTKFQVLLIKYKLYGAGKKQFYRGLTNKQIKLMDNPNPTTYKIAEEILRRKNYVGGGDMRGRQSFNALRKMGFAYIGDNNEIIISKLGNLFLKDDYDLGEVFFKSLLKWQLPDPDTTDYKKEYGYDIKPFVATMHLINEVNKICKIEGIKPVGISKLEFELFGLTLINYKNIKTQARELIKFRKKYNGIKDRNKRTNLVDAFVEKKLSLFNGMNNRDDYSDNAIRYFRLTRYIQLRGNGYFIDLEPRRQIEIDQVLRTDNASSKNFENDIGYRKYLGNINLPLLPWENENDLRKISKEIIEDIMNYRRQFDAKKITYPKFEFINVELPKFNIKKYILDLRNYRTILQQIEVKFESQQTTEIHKYKEQLQNIFKSANSKPIELERLCTLSLNALNDAINIKPNYPVGDDNEPTFTAPANKPDIECYYNTFNAICEVTMLTNRQQWYAEGQPVMRHLRDFESASDKITYCIFIAPSIHRDTINTYWLSVKYEYEGKKQKIIPLTIKQFLILLDVLIHKKSNGVKLDHKTLKNLFDEIINLTTTVQSSDKWLLGIQNIINNWKKINLGNVNKSYI